MKLILKIAFVVGSIFCNSYSSPMFGQSTMDEKNSTAFFLENLPLLPENIWAGQFSSHSNHQQNVDNGWYLYKDDKGDAVVFDVTGPGCIKSMWGTGLDGTSVFKFYFDGEEKPRFEIGIIDFYSGKHPLFPEPLVSYEKRGNYGAKPFAGNCFVPIPFAKSLRISISGNPKYYHILYEKFPYGTKINTFSGNEDRDYLLMAFDNNGINPWNEKVLTVKDTTFEKIEPKDSLRIFDYTGEGSVRSITLETDGSDDFFQNVYLLIKFDDNPLYNVNAPIGFFFGSPYQATNMESLPLSVEKQSNGKVKLSCFFPMPFFKNISIILHNKSTITQGSVKSKITLDKKVYPKDQTGYFTTFYHKGITEYGRDWLFYESPGTGSFVGVVQASSQEHYCEGNEHFYIDNNSTPQINGTGTEDYYLACYWPNINFNTPFAGSVGDVRILNGGNPFADYEIPGRYYRFHLEMPVPYYSSIDARIQHGARSDIESNYGSIAYLYHRSKPALYQTDYLEVTNTASAGFHSYKTTGNFKGGSLEGKYEGNYLYSIVSDSGLYHTDGQISFNVALNPENNGVRIRRRSDQQVSRQKADVYVDDQFAGTWYDPQSNDILRWYDSEFDIHPDFTKDKKSINIKLVINKRNNMYNFTDFEYRIFCFEN